MKSIKILALALLMFVALPSCNDDKDGGKNSVSELQKNIVGEWQLTDWNGAAQPFDVYVDFKEDGSTYTDAIKELEYLRKLAIQINSLFSKKRKRNFTCFFEKFGVK